MFDDKCYRHGANGVRVEDSSSGETTFYDGSNSFVAAWRALLEAGSAIEDYPL